MKKVFEDKRRFTVGREEKIPFSLPEKGLYLIAVSARARNARLISKDATDDEDLTLEIDDRSFPHLTVKGRRIDSPASFSGGTQKGRRKTVYIILKLGKGDHKLKLTPDKQARFEGLQVFLLKDEKQAELLLKTQAEDGNRRSWLTFALIDLPLREFSTTVRVWKRFRDSDDVKLKVNGEMKVLPQPPKQNFLWRLFRWVGSLVLGEAETATFITNFPKGIHYVEFIADRKPRLETLSFDLSEPKEPSFTDRVKPYTYKGVRGDEDYNRFDKAIEDAVKEWNDHFSSQEYPPKELLDPNIVKAMIYIESSMGYFETKEGQYPAYPDVMQVADPRNPAFKTLQGELTEYEWFNGDVTPLRKLLKENPEVEVPEDSINWGVRWLYHKAQIISEDRRKRLWKDWREAVADYNRNDNWEYQKKIWKIYKQGITPRNIKLWSLVIFLLVSPLILISAYFYSEQGQIYITTIPHEEDYYQSYTLQVDRLNGIRMKSIAILIKGDFDVFNKEAPIGVEEIFKFEGEEGEYIVFRGESKYADQRIILVLEDGPQGLRVLPFVDEYRENHDMLAAEEIIVERVQKTLVVTARNFVDYEWGPDRVWEDTYFLVDAEGAIVQLFSQTMDLPEEL